MDDWGVDVTVGASQKGFMTPPGMAFVWMNAATVERGPGDLSTGYMTLKDRIDPVAHYGLYGGTPPVSHIHAFGEALAMIDEEGGLEAVWDRHTKLASVVWAAVETWSHPEGIGFAIPEPTHRSRAVTTIRTGSIDADRLRAIAQAQCGVTLGLGIGGFDFNGFRIGHMGHVNPPMIMGTLGVIESALVAMGAPLGGSGVAAAAHRLASMLEP